MSTRIAFLRAINLGPTRKFAKADIIAATEAAGGTDVATHINTGNVRFDTRRRSRARIEEALEAAYLQQAGFAVPAVSFTTDELRGVLADADELGAGYEGTQYVSLLKDEPSADLVAAMESMGDERDRARVRGRAVHLLVMDPYHHAQLTNADVEKRLGVATNRNLKVIRAIVGKWC